MTPPPSTVNSWSPSPSQRRLANGDGYFRLKLSLIGLYLTWPLLGVAIFSHFRAHLRRRPSCDMEKVVEERDDICDIAVLYWHALSLTSPSVESPLAPTSMELVLVNCCFSLVGLSLTLCVTILLAFELAAQLVQRTTTTTAVDGATASASNETALFITFVFLPITLLLWVVTVWNTDDKTMKSLALASNINDVDLFQFISSFEHVMSRFNGNEVDTECSAEIAWLTALADALWYQWFVIVVATFIRLAHGALVATVAAGTTWSIPRTVRFSLPPNLNSPSPSLVVDARGTAPTPTRIVANHLTPSTTAHIHARPRTVPELRLEGSNDNSPSSCDAECTCIREDDGQPRIILKATARKNDLPDVQCYRSHKSQSLPRADSEEVTQV